jgi:hypothetical protein
MLSTVNFLSNYVRTDKKECGEEKIKKLESLKFKIRKTNFKLKFY